MALEMFPVVHSVHGQNHTLAVTNQVGIMCWRLGLGAGAGDMFTCCAVLGDMFTMMCWY